MSRELKLFAGTFSYRSLGRCDEISVGYLGSVPVPEQFVLNPNSLWSFPKSLLVDG
jgi:hypothetical protein